MDVTSYLLGKKAGGGTPINNQNKDITVTENGTTTVSADAGYTGLGTVGVTTNVQPDLESKSITITENGTTTVTPTTGKDGLSEVEVTTNVPTSGPDLSEYLSDTITPQYNSENWVQLIKKLKNPIYITGTRWWYVFYKFPFSTMPTIASDASNVETTYNMFSSSKLTSIDLSNLTFTNNLTETNSMFSSCGYLQSINFGNNFDTSNVKTFSYMFSSCIALTSLDLSKWNTSKVENMSNMFDYCSRLVDLDISNFDFSKNVYNNSMFYDCTNLKNLAFGTNLGKGYLTTASANTGAYTLSLSTNNLLTHDSLMSVINGLYDIASAGVQPQQLILGSTNLAKLDAATEVSIATAKGWVVS